ncbi:AhpC/TSA family protein [Nocardiopsis sp. Huas11]|uniref:redoxin domain-containing protein n=1 Tax=Nocardiopsis sp. Huas11 TaxID=2183912 RepID=UPI000EABF508|nr:redoxin domain-containing protein [Nocardiopsis sp. Huas11]RKS05826.1 AhpC/TSA family protein [Nocardiopsis sp. Huas11]
MRPVHTRTAAVAAAAALFLSACGAPEEDGGPTAPADAAPAESGTSESGTSEAPPADEAVDAAHLDFTAPTVGGEEVAGTDYAGAPVVLWFWAPWCTVCRGEAGAIAEAAERHEGEVEFVGVAGLGEEADMAEFVEATGTDGITHIIDEDGTLWAGFGVAGQPAFSFLSPDGTFETHPGTLSEADLDARVAELDG